MKERASHAALQNRILLYMENNDFTSITDLADKLDAHRPAVSRAMHALQKIGLVAKNGRKWNITESGSQEILKLNQQISERAEETTKVATQLMKQSALAAKAVTRKRNRIANAPALAAKMLANSNNAALESARRMADSVTGMNFINQIHEQNKHFLDVTSRFDLPPFALETTDILGISSRIFSTFFAEQDHLTPAIEVIKSVLGSATAIDIDTIMPGIVKPTFDLPDFAWAATTSPAEEFFQKTLMSPVFTSAIDLIKATTLRPSPSEIMAEQMRPFLEFPDVMTTVQPGITELFDQLSREATASLVQTQRLSLEFVEHFSLLGQGAASMLAEFNTANIGLSEMISDLSIIRAQDFTSEIFAPLHATQLSDLAAVTRTYKGYLADSVGDLAWHQEQPDRSAGLTIPTRATAAYVNSVKAGLQVADEDEEIFTHVSYSIERNQPQQFNALFRGIGPNFDVMWRGSWAVLESRSPDRVRQSAHSGREILMQYLEHLAPDEYFSAAEISKYGHKGKVTRKMRVKRILRGASKSAVVWANTTVDALANAMDETYGRLAGPSHDRSVYPSTTEQHIIGLLMALGGMIMFIEASRPKE